MEMNGSSGGYIHISIFFDAQGYDAILSLYYITIMQ